MIMEIFGAGASYDSVPSRPPSRYPRTGLMSRPPLATELFLDDGFFAASLRSFPQCKPIVPYLQSRPPEETVEHALEVLQAEGQEDPERKRQIAAIRYYLHLVISECEGRWKEVAHGITNYVTLLISCAAAAHRMSQCSWLHSTTTECLREVLTSVGNLHKRTPSLHRARSIQTLQTAWVCSLGS